MLFLFFGAYITHGTFWGGEKNESPEVQRARQQDAERNARIEKVDPTGEKRAQKHALDMTMATMGELSQHWRQMKRGDISNREWKSEFRVYLSFCKDAKRTEDLCRKMALTQMVEDGVPATKRLAIVLGLGDQL